MTEEYKVQLDVIEGPLELLLYLIKDNASQNALVPGITSIFGIVVA